VRVFLKEISYGSIEQFCYPISVRLVLCIAAFESMASIARVFLFSMFVLSVN
jgi:hypothetical protein